MPAIGFPAKFDSSGGLLQSSNAIEVYSSLKPFDSSGNLVVSTTPGAPIRFTSCLPFNANGSLYIVDKASAVAPFSYVAGLKYDANGAIVTVDVGSASAPTSSFGGVKFDSTGALVIASTLPPGDPYYANVSLLLHFDGTDGSTTIVDNSPSPKTFTCGGSAQLDNLHKYFGPTSLWMDGSDTLIGPTANADFDFGSGDFTIEGFFRHGFSNVVKILCTNRSPSGSDYGFAFHTTVANGLQFTAWNPAGTVVVSMSTATVIFASAWRYAAVKRLGSAFSIWLDGTQVATATYSGAIVASPNPFVMGYDPSAAGRDWIGHLDEWRITKGVARDVSVIPSVAFLDY